MWFRINFFNKEIRSGIGCLRQAVWFRIGFLRPGIWLHFSVESFQSGNMVLDGAFQSRSVVLDRFVQSRNMVSDRFMVSERVLQQMLFRTGVFRSAM